MQTDSNLPRRQLLRLLGLLAMAPPLVPRLVSAQPQNAWDPGRRYGPPRAGYRIAVGAAVLQVDFAPGELSLPDQTIVQRIEMAARAVALYYGRFPVSRARILIVPAVGDSIHGTTWGGVGGWPVVTRVGLGRDVTRQQLLDDWTITHELVHMAFPTLPDDQHWMEEGLATYIEPIARVQAGQLAAGRIWSDMLNGMPQGEPRPGDRGLDRTHTWGRTYWGGALFCLVADIEIRKQTGNRKCLRDALRAILAAGGAIDREWPLTRALEIGDQATGTHVLTTQYKQWSTHPMPIDLSALWKNLGVTATDATVQFDASAPLASIRAAITAR